MTLLLRSVCRLALIRAVVVAALLGLISVLPASGAQFNVTSDADSGAGTLRQALLDAASTPGNDEVVVQVTGVVITLASELLWNASTSPNAVTIEGGGLRVDFNGAPRGFVDDSGLGLTIRNMEITGVGGTSTQDAAPVLSQGGAIVVDQCTIFGNDVTTTDGDVAGAVLSEGGPVTVTACTIFGNHARTDGGDAGGAVLSEGGSITVSECMIRTNTANGPFDGGTVLSEGGALSVSTSTIEHNIVRAGNNAGGGLESEGGPVTVSDTTINCNRATAGASADNAHAPRSVSGAPINADAAGGLLSEGGTVNVRGSMFVGNVGIASGEGRAGSAIVSNGPEPVVIDTTIDENTGSCGDAIASFFLPKRVKVKINAEDALQSRLVAAGFIDMGPEVVDLKTAASLDVGSFHFDAPSLTPKRNAFILESGGTKLTITPNTFGSSRAKFKLKTVGDLTGMIDPEGLLDLHFKNATVDAGGTVQLTGGKYALGKVRGALIAPNLYLARARTTLKGPGKDSLAMVVGLATGGTTPPAASDVTIGFGDKLLVTIPASSFTKVGDRFLFTGPPGSITKVVLDYARERVAIVGKGLDLGTFAEGGNRVLVSIRVGDDARAVVVRMGRKGATMKY